MPLVGAWSLKSCFPGKLVATSLRSFMLHMFFSYTVLMHACAYFLSCRFVRRCAWMILDQICELNLRGDLLTTYAHNWVQGDAVVECEDFDTGERITIEVKSGAVRELYSSSIAMKNT